MRLLPTIAFLLCAGPTLADVVLPVRTIRAREIISAEDVVVKSADVPGALQSAGELVGKEARVALYAGRPIRPSDVGPPALIGRNQMVTLVFDTGSLRIVTEGRALARAAAGESVRVMNIASRATVIGFVRSDGTVEVR